MALMLYRSIGSRVGNGKTLLSRTNAIVAQGGGRVLNRIEQWIQVATLIPTHGDKYPYAEPFDYKNKKFRPFWHKLDDTQSRLNPNSKVILVEGNVAVGKNEFAKKLADNFDLKYFPSVAEADCYRVHHTGFDKRELDPQLPPHIQHYDLKKFYADPNPQCGRIGQLQTYMYQRKFLRYAEAILHVLSTGQGVVVTRSVFGDLAFADALRQCNYVSRNFLDYYDYMELNTMCEIPHPHVTIYLDAPVPVLRQRIKERNNPMEQNSAVLSDRYLEAIDEAYKTRVLPELRETGEVIEIDWTEKADDIEMDVIVEELAELQLENDDRDDPKFLDWEMEREDHRFYRTLYHKEVGEDAPYALQKLFLTLKPPMNVPEICISGADYLTYRDRVELHPAVHRRAGWNPEFGNEVYMRIGN